MFCLFPESPPGRHLRVQRWITWGRAVAARRGVAVHDLLAPPRLPGGVRPSYSGRTRQLLPNTAWPSGRRPPKPPVRREGANSNSLAQAAILRFVRCFAWARASMRPITIAPGRELPAIPTFWKPILPSKKIKTAAAPGTCRSRMCRPRPPRPRRTSMRDWRSLKSSQQGLPTRRMLQMLQKHGPAPCRRVIIRGR